MCSDWVTTKQPIIGQSIPVRSFISINLAIAIAIFINVMLLAQL